MTATAPPVDFPVNVGFSSEPTDRNRVSVFFRMFLAIPVSVVLYFYGIAVWFTSLIAWFAILLTGRYPQGLYRFADGYMRLTADAYGYMFLLTDEFPPFSGHSEKAAGYPIQYGAVRPSESNRLTVAFRAILAIPIVIFAGLLIYIVEFIALVAWFAILFTGRFPDSMLSISQGVIRSVMRAHSYAFLLVDQYPPFSLE